MLGAPSLKRGLETRVKCTEKVKEPLLVETSPIGGLSPPERRPDLRRGPWWQWAVRLSPEVSPLPVWMSPVMDHQVLVAQVTPIQQLRNGIISGN